jgi:hypothetical protein
MLIFTMSTKYLFGIADTFGCGYTRGMNLFCGEIAGGNDEKQLIKMSTMQGQITTKQHETFSAVYA